MQERHLHLSVSNVRRLREALAFSLLLSAGGCLALSSDAEPCETSADCAGEDTFCGTRACKNGACTLLNVRPAGELPPGQALGDCKTGHCDGKGNFVFEADPTDLPDDGNECTEDTCVQGTPKSVPSSSDKPCGVTPGLVCNGAGVCTGCVVPADCGADTPCVQWGCDMAGTCSRNLQPVGTLAGNPLPGDCKASLCDAQGKTQDTFYQEDPADDGDDCTVGVCSPDGTTVHNAAPDGTACGGMPCMACTDGACDMCKGNYYCNVDKCSPLQQVPVGAACTDSIDCAMGNCVDGVCCDGPCGGACSACSNAKTGQPNGVCAPVPDGSDPDNDCAAPDPDVCVGGKCQCYNGVKDGTEQKVDCGGNCNDCPGIWACDGAQGCTGAASTVCCGVFCQACTSGEAECKAMEGNACLLGDAAINFTVLENDGTCDQCRTIKCSCL